jgi:D-alanyl-D-alanine carboxypeptidase/D-alanyl-D-alanine-endopeptidase (penicillin-binding protein 4)
MRRIFPLSLLLVFIGCTPSSRISKTQVTGIQNNEVLKNAHVGISVYDATDRRTIYEYQSDKYFVPASNTKIPTCYVGLKYLSDSMTTFRYAISGDTIFIQPSGDPVFLHPEFSFQPAFELVKRYQHVVVEDAGFKDFLGSGWSWNDYLASYMAQRSDLPMYGNVARFRFQNGSVSVQPNYFTGSVTTGFIAPTGFGLEKPWEENVFHITNGQATAATIPFRPDFKTMLALLGDTLKSSVYKASRSKNYPFTIATQKTDSMLTPMMHRSDNFFAEQTLVMAANNFLGKMSLSQMIDTVIKTEFSSLPQKPRWVDGSGLSRYNLFTPASFVSILDKMQQEFGMERIKNIFPTGNEGTLTGYYTQLPGRIYAKTGTLSGVVALSGYIYSKQNKLLIFSVLVNNHQSTAQQVRRTVEAFLNGIAEQN